MHPQSDIPDAATWARLSPLLDEALDLPPPERAAWLAALQLRAPQDAALLQGLLERHEAASRDNFLAGSAHKGSSLPAAGHRMGPWTIEAPLGEGGMASVWLARRSDGRHDGQAAIKLMHGRLHGTQASQRFEREGRILARLEHPHIARLLDAGVASDGDGGQPYLVLELVRGEPIDRWCDERRLDVEGRLRLFVDVVQAVAAAHVQLVVHRDLKLGNVLVDGQGQVKLLDFGIARLLDEGEDSAEGAAQAAHAATRTGQRAYTPAWAAPEQMRGEPVSTATDVWALGVLLCQLLTGRHPSGLPWTSELTAWMQAAALPDMKRPSQLAGVGGEATTLAAARGLPPLRLARRLQGELDQIVLRALAEEPGRRYASAQALADDVLRHLRNEPVSAVADTVGYRATKFVRRNRLAVGAASTTLLALLAGVVGTTWQALEARAQRDVAQTARVEAVAQAQRAVRERDAAEATDEFLSFLLTSTPGKAVTAKELLVLGEAQALRQFKDAPLLRARLQLALAGLYSEIDEPNRMLAVLDSARKATDAAGPEAAGLRALGDCMRASDLIITPDAAVAQAAYDAALPVLRSGPHADPTLLVSCLSFRSVRTTQAGLPKDAAEQYREALQVLGTPRPCQRSLSLALRLGLAWNKARMGELGAGIPALRAGLLEHEEMGRGHTGAVASWTNNLPSSRPRPGSHWRPWPRLSACWPWRAPTPGRWPVRTWPSTSSWSAARRRRWTTAHAPVRVPAPAATCSAWRCSTRLMSAVRRLWAAQPVGNGAKSPDGICKASCSRPTPCSRGSNWPPARRPWPMARWRWPTVPSPSRWRSSMPAHASSQPGRWRPRCWPVPSPRWAAMRRHLSGWTKRCFGPALCGRQPRPAG